MRSAAQTPVPAGLAAVHRRIVACTRCPRLRAYCRQIAQQKRAAFRHERYWGRPLPGFGDPAARLLVLGLAPAAHGGNRTGRIFTGDQSGHFLMRALYAAGFANQPTSTDAHDGLRLTDAFMTAAVRCAPPGNKPRPDELANCLPHLEAELEQLPRVRVIVALGRIAYDTAWRLLARRNRAMPRKPPFAHGRLVRIEGGPVLIASYHPSQQNTFTGKLTAAMLARVFRTARRELDRPGR